MNSPWSHHPVSVAENKQKQTQAALIHGKWQSGGGELTINPEYEKRTMSPCTRPDPPCYCRATHTHLKWPMTGRQISFSALIHFCSQVCSVGTKQLSVGCFRRFHVWHHKDPDTLCSCDSSVDLTHIWTCMDSHTHTETDPPTMSFTMTLYETMIPSTSFCTPSLILREKTEII